MSTVHLEPGQRPIAVGRTAEIYACGPDSVLKLYREGSSRAYVAREARVSRIVHSAGLPAPGVYNGDDEDEDGLVEIEGRLGILYEWIDGPTMLRDLASRPWMAVSHAKALAALHAQIHDATADDLPDLRARIERAIETAAPRLPDGIAAAARNDLAGLPEGDRVCHGDFHPGNVLLGDAGPVLVDWGPASAGYPAADVAWTILLFRFAGSPVGSSLPVRLVVRWLKAICLRFYRRTYSELTGITQAEIDRWLGVIAILRLTDKIPHEREPLLRLIRRRFGRDQ